MATVVLSAAGAAVGAGFGGTVLGLSGAVIGRAAGAVIGQVIDNRLMSRVSGQGSALVETGRVERFRLTGAGEGQPIARAWGRVRLSGHVIWASEFEEYVTISGGEVVESGRGGKGGRRQVTVTPQTRTYGYKLSLALGVCEGTIQYLGRIWADGAEIGPDQINLRVYHGDEAQLPDPKIEAVEGAGQAPAFRGLAYVVIEDLDLAPWGNRVPVFSFEVVRAASAGPAGVSGLVRGVAMIPGCGEYALSEDPVHYLHGPGQAVSANQHSPGGRSNLEVSLAQLTGELPRCEAVSLVVSWFGSDLRCGFCEVKPKVEQAWYDAEGQPWRAGGIARGQAEVLVAPDGRSLYGGTPADASVIQAVRALQARGQAVMFYPFILMEQVAGNGRPDPWSGAADQPVAPWRGRITLSVAPGRAGSPDRTPVAAAELAAFLGTASPADFTRAGGAIWYSGAADDWGYRRFILHNAHLCAEAGGVEAFCIGSELRGLTSIRAAGDVFPMVAALRQLAGEVRAILGPACKISYAADWSEYWGCQTAEGDRYFHLDPLWADTNIDFIGIDNYMPLSDWRDGETHADAAWQSVLNPAGLAANIEGGEGFDWYYSHAEAEELQIRTPITDGLGEPWIWRYKDLRSWWSQPHHNRIAGERATEASPWQPRSKPFWFTELGCAAVERGSNQPNLFLDAKSSESGLPKFSSGRRDESMQTAYLQAMLGYWQDPAHNPVSPVYGGAMIEMSRAFVWAWDARPWPWFPGRGDLWSDGNNHARGHWLTGRASHQPLAAVVAEICTRAGVQDIDISQLWGVVQGYVLTSGGSGRAALQGLMQAFGIDAFEREGRLTFRQRSAHVTERLGPAALALDPETGRSTEVTRGPEVDLPGEVRIGFISAEGEFSAASETASVPDRRLEGAAFTELPVMLTRAEARAVAERWLGEARVARDLLQCTLPPSCLHLGAGDVVDLEGLGRFRIDRAELTTALTIEAARVEAGLYQASDFAEERLRLPVVHPHLPVWPVFLDLPLLRGDEDPTAPLLAVTSAPWAGPAGLWESDQDEGYALSRVLLRPATAGVTLTPLKRVRPGLWDRGPALRLRLVQGALSGAAPLQILNGVNVMAIGDGSPEGWEVMQFAAAEPMAPGEWEISMRLRGQAGSEARMPEVWPPGSVVVLLNAALEPVAQPAARRGLARHYRVAPLAAGYTSAVAQHVEHGFRGEGLRPLAPVHLRHEAEVAGDRFSWIRRSRIEADSWEAPEIPLGESREAYLVQVEAAGQVLLQREVAATQWLLSPEEKLSLGISSAWSFAVAQLSERYGPGHWQRIFLPG